MELLWGLAGTTSGRGCRPGGPAVTPGYSPGGAAPHLAFPGDSCPQLSLVTVLWKSRSPQRPRRRLQPPPVARRNEALSKDGVSWPGCVWVPSSFSLAPPAGGPVFLTPLSRVGAETLVLEKSPVGVGPGALVFPGQRM